LKNSNQALPNSSNRYAFADGLRGLAALWVVLYHLYHGKHITQLTNAIGELPTTLFFAIGNLGVPVFFVLSGFVMAVTTQNKSFDLGGALRFVARRFVRLSPPYYFSILLAISLMIVKKTIVDPAVQLPTVSSVLAHMLYIQDFLHYPEINVAYWTLCFEIQFYLVFACILYAVTQVGKDSKWHHLILIIATLAGVIWLAFPELARYFGEYINTKKFFIRFWYAFSLGALVGWSLKARGIMLGYIWAYILLIFFIGIFNNDMFAIASACTSFLLMLAQYMNTMNSWLNYKPLQWLGLISYSLYLLHNSLIGLTANVIRKLFPGGLFTELALAGACLVVCIIFSYWMYQFIEKPVIKVSQKIKY